MGRSQPTIMKPENKKFLEDNEHTWITLRDAGYMMGLDGATRSRMVAVIHEEFQPGYATDMWCPPCVADMVTLLYRHYNAWKEKQVLVMSMDEFSKRKSELLESWLKENAGKVPLLDGEIKFIDLSEKTEEPAKPIQPIKASFPKHPNKHRR